MSPNQKTIIAVSVFSLAGVVSFFVRPDVWEISLPFFLFYILFMINSFFSFSLFFPLIDPRLKVQRVIDAILAITYIAMAFSLHRPLTFSLLMTFFFILGTTKYVLLRSKIDDQPKLLKRKITANSLAALLGFFTAIISLLGQKYSALENTSGWFLFFIFLVANIYIFFISPLYRYDKQPETF